MFEFLCYLTLILFVKFEISYVVTGYRHSFYFGLNRLFLVKIRIRKMLLGMKLGPEGVTQGAEERSSLLRNTICKSFIRTFLNRLMQITELSIRFLLSLLILKTGIT